MRIAILTAVLGNFDTLVDPVKQDLPEGVTVDFHRFTDVDFPPITGLTPRLQYRIPKLFGWQMFPDYDIYIWLDGSMGLQHKDSLKWMVEQLGDAEIAFFKHPWRNSIQEEVDHIEEKLQEGNKYIVSRYNNGLHKEQLEEIRRDKEYVDDHLFASTAFIYRNTPQVQDMLKTWWFYQSRYYTCDQVCLPWVLDTSGVVVNTINEDIFNCPFISLVSKHK